MEERKLSIKERGDKVLNRNYKRFPVSFIKGKGNLIYDENNDEYLDFAGGIAVNSLGHAHPEITQALAEQSSTLTHTSNLYYNIKQVELAEKINSLMGNCGKLFFCNSGAEANECIIKLARKFGHKNNKFEIITAINSFHGRTFGGMSATGQDKIKKGFEPLVSGFKHVKFNDFSEIIENYNENTCAILIEGIQGEGGVIPATAEYLKSIRKFCNEKNILFLIDSVQCGFFRSGKFQSYQKILELDNDSSEFRPDAIAMAKSLGSGFPIGAAWIADKYQEVLDAGSHGSTYGGNPLACAVALKTIEIVERDQLPENVNINGKFFFEELLKLKNTYPTIIEDIRGLGFMIGIKLKDFKIPEEHSELTPAAYFTLLSLEQKLLVVPASTNVIRILPALNTNRKDIEIGLSILNNIFLNLN